MTTVLDSSAVLAALLGEPGGDVVADALENAVISAANLSEVAHSLVRNGNSEVQSRALISALGLDVIAVDEEQALDCGFLRSKTDRFGLSLGDRFCFALGRRLASPVMTADRIWREAAASAEIEVILIR